MTSLETEGPPLSGSGVEVATLMHREAHRGISKWVSTDTIIGI